MSPYPLRLAAALAFAAAACVRAADVPAPAAPSASPIFGVTLPAGYRQWTLVAPAHEAGTLNEVRAVVGNPVAIAGYGRAARPFPDGTILVKLAWKDRPLPGLDGALLAGHSTTVQVMVKDAKRYASTGGWGFGRFVDGVAVDAAQHRTCFACHQAHAADSDFVFTRYAQ